MTNKRNRDETPPVQEANKVPTIIPMNEECISFIKSGEKINDIETIVRELVENSMDANATRIDVKLTKFGKDAIEIDDNGSGIDDENLDFICKRYHTSKINIYDRDHAEYHKHITTFGFRGEALYCLSNIANLTISTKSANSPTGTKLTFNSQGKVIKKETVARQNGTTVMVKNIFHSLPVRRKDLDACCKKQYDKIVRLLQEFVLIRPDIKFTLCKANKFQVNKDFTYGGTTLENTIIAIFGVKVMESLIPIHKSLARKIINETSSQSSTISYIDDEDTNSKDSGDVCKQEQKLEPISTLSIGSQFYRKLRSSKEIKQVDFKVHGYISKSDVGLRHSNDHQFLFVNQKPCEIPRITRLINETYRNYTPNQTPFYCLFVQVQSWAADFNVPRKRAVILSEESKLCDMIKKILHAMYAPSDPAGVDCMNLCNNAQLDIVTFCSEKPQDVSIDGRGKKRDFDTLSEPEISDETPTKKPNNNVCCVVPVQISDPNEKNQRKRRNFNEENINCNNVDRDFTDIVLGYQNNLDSYVMTDNTNDSLIVTEKTGDCVVVNENTYEPIFNSQSSAQTSSQPLAIEYFKVKFRSVTSQIDDDIEARVDHLDDLAECLARERAHRAFQSDCKQYSFAIHPDFSRVSEDQLKINLKRESFENMEIVGQFNKGFIITKFNDHLFIVDQHASDERYNFEDQMDRYPLERQAMVRPKPLLLTLTQENSIINYLAEFEKRGFNFFIDETKPPGYRVMLSSTSICKGVGLDVHLDKTDIEELVNVVINSPSTVDRYTLEKVKNLAATRACRKSVMIGDSLTRSRMKDIVDKMSGLMNPWICAHGRPTIRHLMDVQWMYQPVKRPKWIEMINVNQ